MGLLNAQEFDAEGKLLGQYHCHGSCTGVYGWGHTMAKLKKKTRILGQGFSTDPGNHSRELAEAFVNSPLGQGMFPGATFDKETATVTVTVEDDTRSDKLASFFRVLKCLCRSEGYYMEEEEFHKCFDKYDTLELWQKAVILIFGTWEYTDSDSQPGLSYMPLGAAKGCDNNKRYGVPSGSDYHKPRFGMLLPLLRGQSNPGWQTPAKENGYWKASYATTGLIRGEERNPYGRDAHKQMLALTTDDTIMTINNVFIFPEANEGPFIGNSKNHNTIKAGIKYLIQNL